jgi:hypothetical protein
MLLALLAKIQAKQPEQSPLPKTMVFLNTAAAAQAAWEAVLAAGYSAVPFHKEVRWLVVGGWWLVVRRDRRGGEWEAG